MTMEAESRQQETAVEHGEQGVLPNDRTTTDGAAGRPAGISKPQKGLLQRRGFFWSIVGAVVAVVIAVPLAFFFWGNGGTAAVPDGFPAQEQLPLADGERIASSDPDGDLMSVTIRVDDAEAQQAAVEQMQAAGFWVTGQSGSGPIGHVVSMSSDEFTARLSFSHSEEAGYQIKYMIAQR